MNKKKFNTVATGGTFDEFHIGHLALLSKAFEVANKVIVGVSSDEFAKVKGKSKLNHKYEDREKYLREMIQLKFGGDANYIIVKLDTEFGPAVTNNSGVEALIASTETACKGIELNKIRAQNSLNPVEIVTVSIVHADDGSPVSSTRIRNGEIDSEGKIVKSK